MKFLNRIWHFINVYKPSHEKSHFSKKISIFCKKIITFSISAHLMKKSTFLPKFQFFFVKNWHSFTKIDIDRNTCHFASKFARHYFITELRNSLICPNTDTFCIKCYFLIIENATQNWHFSKTEDTSLRRFWISIKKLKFWKWWPFATKMKKILQNWRFCKIFAFTSKAHITKKLILLLTNCHCFQNWQLKYF